MKITNEKYKNLNLASQNSRGDNFVIDFFVSSLLAIVVIYFTYYNIFLAILIYYVVRFLYYFVFESVTGKTLGKYQTQTKVVNLKNVQPNKTQLLKRNLVRFVSLTSAINDKETAIHDSFSNTFVVNDLLTKPKDIYKIIRLTLFISIFITEFFIFGNKLNKINIISVVLFGFLLFMLLSWLLVGTTKQND
jgi:uncharacterized RDD family membrane protein YckC